jgi:hypothetical protein
MVSTIGTNVRGWREISSTAHWTARCLWDTGIALYAVVQDTGATPKLRVMKADSRTAPTAWTEQDSADNTAITNVDYPFSSWLHTNGDLHIVAFSATNTLTHYVFDTDTDQWATGNGNISTAVENEHNVRCCVRSDGDILAFFTSNADDADLGWFVWQGANWTTGGVTGILSANSTGASNVLDAGIDSTDRAWVVFYDPSAGDVSYVTVNSANTVGTVTDIDATGPANLNQNSGARYTLYDEAGTDTIIAAYRPQASAIEERVVTLEADADAANLATEVSVEATTTDVGTRTPVSTAVVGGVPYCAWWDDAASGTIKVSTKSGGAWATETDFATGITKLIEIVPVGSALAVVYQSSNDVLFDWIVASGTPASMAVTAADATAAGGTVTLAAASLFAVTAATSTAAGGTVALTAASKMTVTPADAEAPASYPLRNEEGEIVYGEEGQPVYVGGPPTLLTAASLFSVVAADASAAGGDVALTGTETTPGTLAVDPATASADGGTVALTGAAVLAVGVAPSPPTFVGASTASAAGISCTPAPPTGTQAGDVMVAFIAINNGDSASLITGGAGGWTTRGDNTNASGVAARVFSRVATGSEPATYTASDIDLADSTGIRCTILAYRPAAGTTLSVSGVTPQANASGTSQETPAVVPSGDNAMLVVFGAAAAGRSWTAPPGMDERADDAAHMTIGAFDVVQATAASVSKTATLDTADVAVMAIVAATPEAVPVAAASATAAGGTVTLTAASLLTVAPATATAAADATLDAAATFTVTPATADAAAFGDLTGESDIPGVMGVNAATADAAGGAVLFTAPATLAVVAASASAAADGALTVPNALTVSASAASADGGAVSLAGNGALVVTPATASADGEDVTFDAAALMTIAAATAIAESTSVLSGQGALAVSPTTASAAASATILGAATFAISSATATATADADFVASAPASLVVAPAAASASADATLTGNVAMVVSPADATATGDASFSASSVFTIDVAEAVADGTDVVLRAPQWFVLYARVMIDPAVSFSTRLAPSATGGDLRHGPSVSAALAVEAG